MAQNLKVIPLGGLGAIGKNMTVYEYGRNIMVVDCGVMFPENDMFGIDLVLPDFNYVIENQDKLRGIVVTHGHMDHILALPYLLREVSTPIYGTRLTLGLIERILDEKNLLHQTDLRLLKANETTPLGPFRVTPFAVAHSIPDSVGLVIKTPIGNVVHTGDYKLDETPAGGYTTDLQGLRKLTKDGVLAMVGDSTNADRPGRTPTEQIVRDTLDELFAAARGQRIIIATFSSLLARLQEIIYLAEKHGRKVALTGRSLEQNITLARELGYLEIPKGLLVDVHANVARGKMVVLATGSQGEPRSALNRMANGQHRQVRVQSGDTIIISGGTIPGNEEDVGRMLNKLFERGANVIYGRLAEVHVSGHGSLEDMRLMLEAVKPKFFIPAHGEPRHLHLHSQLAQQEAGMKRENIFVLSDGAQWITDGDRAWTEESLDLDEVFVDGRLVGEIGEVVMRDRRRLSQDGFIVALIPVNQERQLAGEPQLVSRGFVYLNEAGDLLDAGREEIKRHVSRGAHNLRRELEDFFYRETRSRPVVLPRFIQV
ncbi:MAG TPA: ribonuclease J [Candidatus Sulfomarinibacteraceae bacterium]|nr:ribonuclease J [Candidatus Sulfomarinibacteraceae bacterium]